MDLILNNGVEWKLGDFFPEGNALRHNEVNFIPIKIIN